VTSCSAAAGSTARGATARRTTTWRARWPRPGARGASGGNEVVCGDCHLARSILQETGTKPVHPIQLMARAYGIAESRRERPRTPQHRRHLGPACLRARARRLPPKDHRAQGQATRRARAGDDLVFESINTVRFQVQEMHELSGSCPTRASRLSSTSTTGSCPLPASCRPPCSSSSPPTNSCVSASPLVGIEHAIGFELAS